MKDESTADYTEDLLHHLLDGIKEYAIFMVDTDGKIVTWNTGVQRLLGYEENAFIGKSFSIIFGDEDVANKIPEKELARALSAGNAEDERWHRKCDGSMFWASGLVTRVERDGKTVGFTKIMRDRTDKKLQEQEAEKHAAALTAANLELEHFASVLSHDINSPLQTMCTLAGILKDQGAPSADALESIERIESSAESVMTLVNDVLEYSKTTDQPPPRTLINGNELLDRVVSGLDHLSAERNVNIVVDALPTFYGNETNVERVVRNLVENAVKYSRPATQVEISATEKPDSIVVAVQDHGRGIPANDTEKIFGLFERVDHSVRGRGLGLAISKKLVHQWGGELWVDSRVGQGSTFYFSVPSSVGSARPKTDEAQSAAA